MLVVAALAVAVSAVGRSFFQPPPGQTGGPPVFVDEWEDALAIGRGYYGAESAPVKLMVLSDLECPVCRGFHEQVVKELVAGAPEDVQVVFVHFPLNYHRFARPAARIAECLEDPSEFVAFIDAVYAKQDSLGLKSWLSYGIEAGVDPEVRVEECASGTSEFPRIDAGVEFGETVDAPGTPTVILNGWMFRSTPGFQDLQAAITKVRAGDDLD